jgi:hypothetical protein
MLKMQLYFEKSCKLFFNDVYLLTNMQNGYRRKIFVK